MRARHRVPPTFYDGQMVFVWRQPRVGSGKWHGPGVIVLPTAGGAWVNMRGSLWRVANEQMRPATQDESQGIEMVNRYLHDMKQQLEVTRGARRYVDVAREGPPSFLGEPDVVNISEEAGLDLSSDDEDNQNRTPPDRQPEPHLDPVGESLRERHATLDQANALEQQAMDAEAAGHRQEA